MRRSRLLQRIGLAAPAPIDDPRIRQVSSPLWWKTLAPLGPRCQVVQFDSALRENEYARVATFLSHYPDVTLRAYGNYDGRLTDLEFLRHFPFLRRFQVDIWKLESLDGLFYLPSDLRYLGLGQTRKAFSLRVLERFPELEELYLEGHHKAIDVLEQLTNLRELTLRSITLPDLSPLRGLRQLWSLDIKLGGTKDLSALPEIGQLKYLELWMIRGLEDIQPISQVTSLQFLFLQALRRVETLPALGRLSQLRRLHLETMKGLTDITPIAEAPTLEDLLVLDTPQLRPEQFKCLVGHPRLQRASIDLGSLRRNEAASRILGLPRSEYIKDDDFFR